jgi:DNA-binding response OmpR family regulator
MSAPRARHTLLLVDPDEGVRRSLADQLEQEGFATACVAAIDEPAPQLPALILLGPGALAAEAIQRWRPSAPVIALIDRGQEQAAGNALFAAFLTRPVRIAELVALIERLILAGAGRGERAIGPYLFQPAAKLLREPARNRTVRLTEKEAAMLELLYRAGAEGLSRERLLAEVWGYSDAVTTHTLETHIYRLRRKIERDAGDARLLLTEPGGYRLVP